MPEKYNHVKAMFSVTKASLRSTFRSPSAVVFSIAFPLIFILVFGFIGGGNGVSLDVAWAKNTDSLNPVYKALNNAGILNFEQLTDSSMKQELEKGNITAIIAVKKNKQPGPAYEIELRSSEAVKPQNLQVLQSLLNAVISNLNKNTYPNAPTIAAVNNKIEKIPGREYRYIDFILPGQLGFSLLSAGVFGVAFLFFNLRQQLVLKRFFATPVRRGYIVVGEAISRVTFQLSTAVIIIGVGVLAFNYTLIHGFATLLEILLLSFLTLVVFMGFGFIVSGLAKNESTIPPFANLFTLPQFLLAGTFFSISVFPKWLQFFCNLLPLTHFNNAMRKIAFEGATLCSTWQDVGVLVIWGIILYALAIKFFRWE